MADRPTIHPLPPELIEALAASRLLGPELLKELSAWRTVLAGVRVQLVQARYALKPRPPSLGALEGVDEVLRALEALGAVDHVLEGGRRKDAARRRPAPGPAATGRLPASLNVRRHPR